jgi:hypothetical protein
MKQYIDKQDISHIYWELWENGLPKVVSANEIKAIEPMAFRQFLHEIGVYACCCSFFELRTFVTRFRHY